jgi:hypothetical protein
MGNMPTQQQTDRRKTTGQYPAHILPTERAMAVGDERDRVSSGLRVPKGDSRSGNRFPVAVEDHSNRNGRWSRRGQVEGGLGKRPANRRIENVCEAEQDDRETDCDSNKGEGSHHHASFCFMLF